MLYLTASFFISPPLFLTVRMRVCVHTICKHSDNGDYRCLQVTPVHVTCVSLFLLLNGASAPLFVALVLSPSPLAFFSFLVRLCCGSTWSVFFLGLIESNTFSMHAGDASGPLYRAPILYLLLWCGLNGCLGYFSLHLWRMKRLEADCVLKWLCMCMRAMSSFRLTNLFSHVYGCTFKSTTNSALPTCAYSRKSHHSLDEAAVMRIWMTLSCCLWRKRKRDLLRTMLVKLVSSWSCLSFFF